MTSYFIVFDFLNNYENSVILLNQKKKMLLFATSFHIIKKFKVYVLFRYATYSKTICT